MTNALDVADVTAGYGRATALTGVSLFLRPGECVACLGANGAGKSTLLRTIAGLHPMRSGSVVLAGEDLTDKECSRRVRAGLALVPEGRRILPLTVGENLRAGQLAAKRDPAQVEAVLDRFPILRERWKAQAVSLSGGEQQMLAIGRALVSQPSVLLLDEPSLGLAPVMIDELVDHLHGIVESGTTVLVVEQNVRLAIRLSSRLYLLRAGSMIDEIPTTEADVHEIARAGYLG